MYKDLLTNGMIYSVIFMLGCSYLRAQQSSASPQAAQSRRFVPPDLDPSLFKITTQLERSGFRIGEPIVVHVHFQNVSTRELIVTSEHAYSDYAVEVFQDNGRLALATPFGRSLRPNRNRKIFGGPHERKLMPLDEQISKIELNKLYELNQPGAYTVVVRRETDLMADRPPVIAWFKAASAPVKFFIVQ